MRDAPLYVSVDVEADGPIPGRNSMLSLGAVVFDHLIADSIARYTPIATYEANLVPLPGAAPDSQTRDWWQHHNEAYAAATRDARPAEVVIPEFIQWLKALPRRPVCVAYPAGFDFTYIHYYNTAFGGGTTGADPFGFSCVDIKSYAAALLGVEYPDVYKRSMPRSWFKVPAGAPTPPKHTHKALEDAIGQGVLFLNILSELGGQRRAEIHSTSMSMWSEKAWKEIAEHAKKSEKKDP